MEVVTLKNGQKAVRFEVFERPVGYYDSYRSTMYVAMVDRKLMFADNPAKIICNLPYLANVIVPRAKFVKLMAKGGEQEVVSGFGDGTQVHGEAHGVRWGTLAVTVKGSRIKIKAPCGATVLMTAEKAEKLVEAVKSL